MVEPLLRKEQTLDGISTPPQPTRQNCGEAANGASGLEAAQEELTEGGLMQMMPKGTLWYTLFGISAFTVAFMLLMWVVHNLLVQVAVSTTSTTTTGTTTETSTTTFTSITSTTTRAVPLDPAAANITFVTAETRGDPMILRLGRFGGRVVNVGLGAKWGGYQTKVALLQRWLHDRLREGRGEELVAFFDGSDIIWGGCELKDFVLAYHRIVKQSGGARVVFSAELVCGEQDCDKVPEVPYWAIEIAGGRPLNGGFWKRYVDGCQQTWTTSCSAKRDCGGLAACSVPPSVKFLNSGFVMGPTADLFKLMDWTMKNYEKWSVWGDQSVFAVYWLDHLREVTLDYLGELAVSLSDMKWDLLERPLHCERDMEVFITSHLDSRLRDMAGKLNMSERNDPLATWILSDAGDGKVFITSGLGRQLADEGGKIGLSQRRAEPERWRVNTGGDGHVFLTSSRKRQLQDNQGSVAPSTNKQGWESWLITKSDGSPACVEDGFKGGVINNFGFNRPTCMIHGNGRGFWFFQHIVKMLTNKTIEELRNWGKHNSLHVMPGKTAGKD